MYLTNRNRHNRNRRVIHIYNSKSVTKFYYDCPGTIQGGQSRDIYCIVYFELVFGQSQISHNFLKTG